jgi:hypothetical protein
MFQNNNWPYSWISSVFFSVRTSPYKFSWTWLWKFRYPVLCKN